MKKIFTVFVLILLIAGGIFFVKKNNGEIIYSEIIPERGDISVSFRTTGSVNPRNRLEIVPPISGRIESILVKEGQSVKKGEIIAYLSSSERAAMIDAARSKGEDELKKWETIYRQTPVIAPIDGFIIARNKEPGQTIGSTDAILVMADKLIVEANVDETDLRYININQEVTIFLDAYPDKKFKGLVEHIAYESQIISNVTVYLVKIKPVTIPPNFRAGMTATVEIESNKKTNAILLPFDTVETKDNKKFLLVKGENGRPERKQIETGINNGKKIEIISGITDEDTILVQESKRNDKSKSRISGMPGIPGGGRR